LCENFNEVSVLITKRSCARTGLTRAPGFKKRIGAICGNYQKSAEKFARISKKVLERYRQFQKMSGKISGHFVKKSGAKPALHRLNLQGAMPVIFKKSPGT
jgi:hypothetical protein